MKNYTRFTALLLICALLGPTACGAKKTDVKTAGPKQPALAQSRDLGKMDPEFLFLAAQNALNKGNSELAINLLEAVVKKDSAAIGPHIQLVETLFLGKQLDKAKRHIAQLLEDKTLMPDQFERLYLLQARLLVIQRKPDDGLASIQLLLKQQPKSSKAHQLKIQILSGLNRNKEALEAIAAAIHIEDKASLRLSQAQLYLKLHDYDSARKSLQRLRILAPDNEMAVLMLGNIAIKERNYKRTEKLLRDFLSEHPSAVRSGHALGQLLAGQGRLEDAILVYRNLVARTGDVPGIQQGLGLLYYQHGDYKQSEEVFRRLLKAHQGDTARFYLAASLEALDRLPEARSLYEEFTENSPWSTEVKIRLAGLDFRDNRLDKAVKQIQEVLQQKPDRMDARIVLSSIRLAQKKFQLLLDETESIMSLDAIPSQILFNRAVAFDHFKKYAQLETMINRVLKKDANHAEALNFLGYAYAEQGIHLEQARAMIQRALDQKPNDGYYLDSLAWVYYKKGEYARAFQTQKKALQQVRDDAVMHEHFGDILWKNKNRKAARNAWKKSIELNSQYRERLQNKIAHGLGSHK